MGMTKISLTAEFKVAMPEKEKLYTPEMLGFSRTTEAELDGGETVAEAARIFDDVLNNRATPAQKNCVIANSASPSKSSAGKENLRMPGGSPRSIG